MLHTIQFKLIWQKGVTVITRATIVTDIHRVSGVTLSNLISCGDDINYCAYFQGQSNLIKFSLLGSSFWSS